MFNRHVHFVLRNALKCMDPKAVCESHAAWLNLKTSQTEISWVGLIAQLVEHCMGIAEVMGSNPIRPEFSAGYNCDNKS